MSQENVDKTPKKELSALEQKQLELVEVELAIKKAKLAQLEKDNDLDQQLKRAQLQDAEEQLANRKLKSENRLLKAKGNGATLRDIARNQQLTEQGCSHLKGGSGIDALIKGGDDIGNYAVIKHTFANADVWIRCLRCGKTWKPPLEEDFVIDGEFNLALYTAAEQEYRTALDFSTRNQMSGSVMFGFKKIRGSKASDEDVANHYRKVTKNTTLR
jgi:hypothetical protein